MKDKGHRYMVAESHQLDYLGSHPTLTLSCCMLLDKSSISCASVSSSVNWGK
jgi:hypothetical protein